MVSADIALRSLPVLGMCTGLLAFAVFVLVCSLPRPRGAEQRRAAPPRVG